MLAETCHRPQDVDISYGRSALPDLDQEIQTQGFRYRSMRGFEMTEAIRRARMYFNPVRVGSFLTEAGVSDDHVELIREYLEEGKLRILSNAMNDRVSAERLSENANAIPQELVKQGVMLRNRRTTEKERKRIMDLVFGYGDEWRYMSSIISNLEIIHLPID